MIYSVGGGGVVVGVLASSIPLNLSYTSISMSSIHYFPLSCKQEVIKRFADYTNKASYKQVIVISLIKYCKNDN